MRSAVQALWLAVVAFSTAEASRGPKPVSCRHVEEVYHGHGGFCEDSIANCFKEQVFDEAHHEGWLWGTRSASDAFLYFRNGLNATLYTLKPVDHNSSPDLLEVARGKNPKTAVASGMRELLYHIAQDEMVNITLWWGASPMFNLSKGETLECTGRNVIRAVFGLQGGLRAMQLGDGTMRCDVEPNAADNRYFRPNDWKIRRWSRTDIDEAMTGLLCSASMGYYSGEFLLPVPEEGFDPMMDQRAKFGPAFVASTTMSPEVFLCDYSRVRPETLYAMVREDEHSPWYVQGNPNITFPDVQYPVVQCL